MPKGRARRGEQLAVEDFRHEVIGHLEQILVRCIAADRLRLCHGRRIAAYLSDRHSVSRVHWASVRP